MNAPPEVPTGQSPEPRKSREFSPRMHADARGFTLLEVLIAFAIASIALAVLYHGAVGGLLGSRLAARTD